ncbi:MAG: hypothetical protein EBR82_17085 [Caulobacteraceae bacterium]|nr:hypothetical protein [Caulobacteraceae bacterium]
MSEDNEQIDNLKLMSDAIYKNFEQLAKLQYEDIVNYSQPKKLTGAPHEILFDVTATVMEENEKGEIIGTKELCNQQYHIPVPIDQNYEIFMRTFFMYIEESLLKASDKAYSQGEPNTNE